MIHNIKMKGRKNLKKISVDKFVCVVNTLPNALNSEIQNAERHIKIIAIMNCLCEMRFSVFISAIFSRFLN